MGLHRRARVDADLALDRRDRPRRAARRARSSSSRSTPTLIAPFWWIHVDADRLRGDQVRERRDHDARRRPDLPARADARHQARRGRRRGRARSPCPRWRTSPRSSPRSSPTRTSRSAPGSRAGAHVPAARRDVDPRARLPRRRLLRPPARVHDCCRSSFVVAAAGLWVTGPRGRRLRRNWTRGDTLGAIALLVGAAVPLQPRRAPARPRVAGPDAVLQEPHGRPRPRRRALARDRPRPAAGDRRHRLAAPARAARRPDLPRLRRLDGVGDRRSSASTSPTRPPTSRHVRDALGGARPDLPLPAAADRHGSRLPGEADRLAARSPARPRFVLLPRPEEAIQLGSPYFEAPGSAIPALAQLLPALDRRTTCASGCSACSRCRCWLIAFRRRRGVAAAHGRARLRLAARGRDRVDGRARPLSPTGFRTQPARASSTGSTARTAGSRSPTSARRSRTRTAERSTEFWNRSIQQGREPRRHRARARSVRHADIVSPTAGSRASRLPYVLADTGDPARRARGRHAEQRRRWCSTEAPNGPWHLLDSVQQVYSDGWCPDWCAYTYFKPDQRGTLLITLGRTATAARRHRPRTRRVTVGTVQLDRNGNPGSGGSSGGSTTVVDERDSADRSRVPVDADAGAGRGPRFRRGHDPADRAPTTRTSAPGRVPVPAHLGAVSESSEPRGGLRVEVARTLEELEQLRPAWDAAPVGARGGGVRVLRRRACARAPDVIGPFAAVVLEPAHAGRRRSPGASSRAGCRRRSATASSTHRSSGCCRSSTAGSSTTTARRSTPLAGAVEDGLGSDEVDVVAFPPLELGSELFRSSGRSAAPLARQPFIAPWTRRAAASCPRRFDDSSPRAATSTRKSDPPRRAGSSRPRSATRLDDRDRARPGRGRAACRATPTGSRARPTSAALGAGFADTPEQRALARRRPRARLAPRLPPLPRRRARSHTGSARVYGDTMLLKTGGFDDAYAEYRVGIYLLMRVIEDACADPALRRARLRARRHDLQAAVLATRAATSGTWSSSRRPSAPAGSTRPGRRSSGRRGSRRGALDAAQPHRPRRAPAGGAAAPVNALDAGPPRADDGQLSALRDLRYGRPLGGTVRSRYEHLGAFHVDELALRGPRPRLRRRRGRAPTT